MTSTRNPSKKVNITNEWREREREREVTEGGKQHSRRKKEEVRR